jgi:hypothetical protein
MKFRIREGVGMSPWLATLLAELPLFRATHAC